MVWATFLGQNDHSDLRFAYEILWFFDGDFRVSHFAFRSNFSAARSTSEKNKNASLESLCFKWFAEHFSARSTLRRLANHMFSCGFWTAILTFGKITFCICFIMVISLLPECKIVTQNRYVFNGLRSIFRLGAPFGGSETICFPMVFEQRFWLLAKSHFAYVL